MRSDQILPGRIGLTLTASRVRPLRAVLRILAPATVAMLALLLIRTDVRARCAGRDLFPPAGTDGKGDPAGIRAEADALPFRFGRLYRLGLDGRAPSYIVGTVHLADPRVTRLTKSVADAVAEAQVVAVETLDGSAGGPKPEVARLLADRRQQRPETLLDPGALSGLMELAGRRGLSRDLVRRLKPTVLALLLDLPACALGNGGGGYLDAEIAAAARARGTQVVGLETLPEQIEAVDGLGTEVERQLLRAILAQAQHAGDIVETTIRRYDESDAGGLLAWTRSPMMIPGESDAVVPPEFLDRLILGRNRRLVERIRPLIDRGGAVVAVGLAHLPGRDGLLVALQEAGIRIEVLE